MKNGHSFNVILTNEQYAHLKAVAENLGVSKGQVMRMATLRLYNMVVLNVPTCANGQRCYVPHMHPPVTSAEKPDQLNLPATGPPDPYRGQAPGPPQPPAPTTPQPTP